MKTDEQSRLLRFVIAGVVNTLFGLAVFALLVRFGMAVWAALLTTWLSGLAFNFLSHGKYVFRQLELRRLPAFALSYITLIITNLAGIGFLERFLPGPIWAQTVLCFPMAAMSYLLLSRWVFVKK